MAPGLTSMLPVPRCAIGQWMRTAGRGLLAGAALAVSLLASSSMAIAQYVNCAAIQSQIAGLGNVRSPQTATYQRAAQKQQAELARTVGYANTIGCNRQRFLFFGDPPPPQCGTLNQRIAAMQGNLGHLQSVVQNGGNEQRRRSLTAQFDAYCRNQVAAARPGNFLEQLFARDPRMQELPVAPPETRPQDRDDQDEPEERGPRTGSMAICVRKCDGGFFPVSYSASRNQLDELGDLCKALCPNAETILFTKRSNAEIDQAVSHDGESYDSLSNAGKYKTKFDPACSCKPANRSWADVLAEAEKLIARKNRRDLIVTPQKAEELSRPKLTGAAARAARSAPVKPALPGSDEDRTVAELEREGRIAAEAASRSSAGIIPGGAAAGQRFGANEGRHEVITTPEGAMRRIRVIGPKI